MTQEELAKEVFQVAFAALIDAVQQEREACAKLVDEFADEWRLNGSCRMESRERQIASAIRSRSQI